MYLRFEDFEYILQGTRVEKKEESITQYTKGQNKRRTENDEGWESNQDMKRIEVIGLSLCLVPILFYTLVSFVFFLGFVFIQFALFFFTIYRIYPDTIYSFFWLLCFDRREETLSLLFCLVRRTRQCVVHFSSCIWWALVGFWLSFSLGRLSEVKPLFEIGSIVFLCFDANRYRDNTHQTNGKSRGTIYGIGNSIMCRNFYRLLSIRKLWKRSNSSIDSICVSISRKLIVNPN